MGRKAAIISIDFNAGTGKMLADLEKGKAEVRAFGAAAQSSMGGATGGIRQASSEMRILEGNISNNTRAVSQFLVQILKLGPAIQASFAAFGAVAFAGMVGSWIGKLQEFVTKAQEAPEKMSGAFRQLSDSLRTTDDELRVSNARLANEIAKLEGKPQNRLKQELEETALAADKLADSIGKGLDAAIKALKQNEPGWADNLIHTLMGQDSSRLNVSGLLGGATGFGGMDARIAQIKGALDSQIDAIRTPRAAGLGIPSAGLHIVGVDPLVAEKTATKKAFEEILKIQEDGAGKLKHEIDTISQLTVKPPAAYQEQLAFGYSQLQAQMRVTRDTIAHQAMDEQKSNAEDAAEKRKAAAEATKRTNEQEKTDREQILKLYKDQLEVQARVLDLRGRLGEAANVRAGASGITDKFVGPVNPGDTTWQDQLTSLEKIKAVKEAMSQLDTEARKSEAAFAESQRADETEINNALKEQSELRKELADWINKAAEETAKLQEAASAESTRHGVAMAGIGGGSTDPIGVLRQQQAIEHQGIEERYQTELQIANEKKDLILLEKAESDYELANKRLENQMEEAQAERRRQQLNDIANPIIGALSGDITKAMTGQKTSFGKDLEGAGRGILQQAISEGLHGAFDKVTGAKPDGSKSKPFWVQMAGQKGTGGLGDKSTDSNSNQGTGDADEGIGGALQSGLGALGRQGLIGTMFKNLLPKVLSAITGAGDFSNGDFSTSGGGGGMSSVDESDWGGMMAAGGDVDPGKAYGVADAGEFEVFTPRNAGTITPAHKLGGSSVTYNIDARGADLGAHNRIARQIEASHQAAVSNSLYAQHEQQKRTPRRSR